MTIEENGTPEEPADEISLTDTLTELWDKAESEAPRDGSGKFTSSEPPAEEAAEPEGESTDSAPEEETTQEQGEAPAIEAPSHWSEADKALFEKAPDELKSWMLDRHKAMEADYTRKTQEVAEDRKVAQEFKQTIQPYEAIMRSEGATPIQAVTELLNMAYVLRVGTPQQKLQLITNTARQFGVDLSQSTAEPEYRDPQIAALEADVDGLKTKLTSQEMKAAQERAVQIQTQVESFKSETTPEGSPKYPHFEKLRGTMGDLIRISGQKGQALSIAEAYEQAAWADKDIRQEILSAQQKAAEKKSEAERKAKAEAAKKAKGLGVKGAAPTTGKPKSIADELSEGWDRASAS